MDRKYIKMLRITAAICLMVAATIRFSLPPKAVSAQSTVVTVFNENSVSPAGEVMVDQTTGAITFCAEEVVIFAGAEPEGNCKMLGRATPGTGTSSLATSVSGDSVFVLNNQTGLILQCAAVTSVLLGPPEPTGTCVPPSPSAYAYQ